MSGGSNIAQIIDILNVLIHRTFQFMMCDEFRIELPCSASLLQMIKQIPRLIPVSVLQQVYLP